MDKQRLNKYRRRLEEELAELKSLLGRTEEAGRSADQASPEDMAEKAANSYHKEFLFRQSDSERVHLHHMVKALERTKSGEFGICEGCGEEIEGKRLDAVPWTPYCRACQEEDEAGGAGSPNDPD